MAKKIGDLIIGLVILLFMITSVSIFVIYADATTGVDSSIQTDLVNLRTDTSDVQTVESSVSEVLDETGDFVPKEDTLVDTRSDNILGLSNLLSKNVIVKFFGTVGETLNIPKLVVYLAGSLIFVTILILIVRGFVGETKI
jgi:hypothetical protein